MRKWVAGLASVIALAQPAPAFAIAQRTGDFEAEIDAPWRMEPRANGYGAIPIQVSIHDADQPSTTADGFLQRLIRMSQAGAGTMHILITFLTDGVFDTLEGIDEIIELVFGEEEIPADHSPVIRLDRFVSLSVSEELNGRWVLRRVYGIEDFHEVERTIGLWRWAANQTGPETPYAPPPRPGYSICRRWLSESCAGYAALRPTSEWNATALYVPLNRVGGRDVRLRTQLTMSSFADQDPYTYVVERILSVHLGEAALPKFDARWAYGDLHYHSQGTDNDGESGYAYRGTVHAMGAMGLDFAFATDHASNSPQIGSAMPIPTTALIQPIQRGLRDLSPDRFAFALAALNGPSGANRAIASYPRAGATAGSLAVPQLFLGSEVDVIPEAYRTDLYASTACTGLPDLLKALHQRTPFFDFSICNGSMFEYVDTDRGLYHDIQGPFGLSFLSQNFYARQHLLHLPTDSARSTAFIPSNTSKYGGATRRLGQILDVELAQRQKGYAFLAHPFANSSGSGSGRVGPDLIPYSSAQLRDAFASPYVLGLQIWNENDVRSADANDVHVFSAPYYEKQHMPFDFWNFARWDAIQLWGLDKSRTDALAWLGANQPRRVFMAGGSDAHGDLNYRREGHFLGTESVSETALGKPRNLVFAGDAAGELISASSGSARPFSQQQVVAGLRSGNFAVTDGPAVRIAIDGNANGQIDDADIAMGGVAQRNGANPFNVIVEWRSTPEFGPISVVYLYMGVFKRGHAEGIVYSPWTLPGVDPSQYFTSYVQPGTGKKFVETPNMPYWFDPTPNSLFVTPLAGEGYVGRRVITIDPKLFPIGDGVCTQWSSFAQAPGNTTTPPISTGGPVALDTSIQQQLEDLMNGVVTDPGPQCLARAFLNAETPERMFLRAEVRNQPAPGTNPFCTDARISDGDIQCVRRRGYTNPVWVNVNPCSTIQCQTAGGTTGGVYETNPGGSTGGSTGGTTGGTTGGVGGVVGGGYAVGGFSALSSIR
jgi:hypothetical protein